MAPLFLTDDELVTLTGRKFKGRQIEWLRTSGIPFRVNATGHPVVTRGAIAGQQEAQPAPQRWTPRVTGV